MDAPNEETYLALRYLVWYFDDETREPSRTPGQIKAALGEDYPAPPDELIDDLAPYGVHFGTEGSSGAGPVRTIEVSDGTRETVLADTRTEAGLPATWDVPDRWREA